MNGDAIISAPDANEEELNLGDLLGVLIENRWLIFGITLVAFLIGGYQAYTAVPIYQADGLLQVEEKYSGLSGFESSSMYEYYSPVNTEIEILRSRSVLGSVVNNLKLDIYAEPELDVPDAARGTSIRLVAVDSKTFELQTADAERLGRGMVGEVTNFSLPGGENVTLFVSAMQAEPQQVFWAQRGSRIGNIQSLQGRLSVAERGEWSGILSLSVQGADPVSVEKQVNEIANVYVRQNVERKSEEAAKTLQFLDEQLPVVRQDMEAAELALNSYRLEKGSIDLPSETQTILQTIVSIEAQLNKVSQEREKVRLAFTELHPTVVALDRQAEGLKSELAELNSQVRDLPSTQQELLSLIRDVEVNAELYTSLLSTSQELRVVKAGTVGNVRVIDYAVTPTSPVKPNRSRIVLLSLLIGAFVGVATAFAKKALRSGVEDPDMIERRISIPVYATISHSRRQDRLFSNLKAEKAERAILAVDKPDDSAIESLRNLRTALHFGMLNVKNNCIMIAGPSPGVGKSFISVNLGVVLASNEKKVLLIDGDLRRGHLNEYLGIERENGLSEFISGEVPADEVLHQTSIPGLTLVPTGALPPNPAELLLHHRFSDLLSTLMPLYDHVLIDSPPILAVTDAAIIGQMVGGTLMVLKAGAHPMGEIELAVKRLKQSDVNLRGILFNDLKASSSRYGAGKYNYQYAYKNK
jgi:tyrosine-protein kinase Etk/Wzc